MRIVREKIFCPDSLFESAQGSSGLLELFKNALKRGRAALAESYAAGAAAEDILQAHSWLVDRLLQRAWDDLPNLDADKGAMELIAVGGYGRAELHPYSDIDLLFLLNGQATGEQGAFIGTFIRFLWDMGLEVGHSTRTLKECAQQGASDITIVTNLMEARLLIGDGRLLERLKRKIDARERIVAFIPEYAAYMMNRLTKGLDGKVAYERIKGKKPTVMGI